VTVDPVNLQLIEETRRQINRLLDDVARMSESDMNPTDYYGELLKHVLQGLAAPAGAVWIRTAQGNLQLQHQINMRQVGLESDGDRQQHFALLRQVIQQPRPIHLPPHSIAQQEEGITAGNPTAYDTLVVPILVDQAVAGLLEIWQSPNRDPKAFQGFLQFMTRMAHLASLYVRNNKLRTIVGQQQLWTQLETYTRQIHGSLDPTEVAYQIANEGRRLIECDRLSIGVRHGRKTRIEAISGADVVEKRSNLVQLMRTLVERVLKWGEKLVYTGVKDDSLPPGILTALDDFLAESNSKLLVIMPLRDEREGESKRPPRSGILMESFEPTTSPEALVARMEVVGRHATSALYNAVEHKRMPGRWIWKPLAKVQEGLGGKARAIGMLIVVALALLVSMFVFVPYPLKMDAKGQLLPIERRWVYSPVEGKVVNFPDEIQPGAQVSERQPLVQMYDEQVDMRISQLMSEAAIADNQAKAKTREMNAAQNPLDKEKASSEKLQYEATRDVKIQELNAYMARTHADEKHRGQFWLLSPMDGTILNWGFQETLRGKSVKPSDPILRVGDKTKRWEIELKIPQKHIGQILQAFQGKDANAELDVDLLVTSAPTSTFRGKLARTKIAGEASPNRDDPNESDPVVLASVRIDGPGIAKSDMIPPNLLVTGIEVHTKVRCGKRAMGYSLFYGLWEFFYEKIVFLF
jgi:hypothetical protein